METFELGYANQAMLDSLVERIRCQAGTFKLDLSLCNIGKVPIQLIQKHYEGDLFSLDLSYNAIRFINPEFTLAMIHLTKLDLSKNQIEKLPDNFGDLEELVYLDLHRNQLKTLPVSMGKMLKLTNLRISANPFMGSMEDLLKNLAPDISSAEVAGVVITYLRFLGTRQNSQHSNIGPNGDSNKELKLNSSHRESNNNLADLISTDDNLKSHNPKAARETFKSVFFYALAFCFTIAAWTLILGPIFIAYVAETPYLEEMARQYPSSYGLIWKNFHKYLHEYAKPIASRISNKFVILTLSAPPPFTGIEVPEDDWSAYGIFMKLKNLLV